MPRNNNIQFRRGTYSEWDSNSSGVLNSGEPGFVTNFNIIKVGDGVTQWSDLPALNDNLRTIVRNDTSNTINKMSVVYINGAQGDIPRIILGIASGEAGSSKTYGIVTSNIATGSIGTVVVDGTLRNLDTLTGFSGVSEGTALWLSPTVSGGITITKPYAPYHAVFVGTLIRVHQTQGVINVKMQNGYELEELHNVATTGATNGQFLQYNSGSGLWFPSSSGNFTSLSVNGSGVSVSGHNHTVSDITNFNSSVSGLLPTIANSGDNRILTSTGSSIGINAETNATFDGTNFNVSGVMNVDNLRLDGNTISSINTNGDLILSTNGTGRASVGANNLASATNSFVNGTNNVAASKVRRANNITSSTNTITVLGATVADFDNTTANALQIRYFYNNVWSLITRTVSSATQSGDNVTVTLTTNVGATSQTWSQVTVVNISETESMIGGTVGGISNIARGNYSTVGGGRLNTSSGLYSTVGGGYNNTSSANYSTVGGGFLNTSSGTNSTVGGGFFNTSSGSTSTVGGGGNNTSSGYCSTVGGGKSNTSSGNDSTIGGGRYNTASGIYSTIGGGRYNTASGGTSTVGGGINNNASGNGSFAVGGGYYNSNTYQTEGNTASGAYSTVTGGHNNVASGGRSVVGGGRSNTSSGNYSIVGGGYSNASSGNYSTVGGGLDNTSSGYNSTVGGGKSNTASGNYSVLSGGEGNISSGSRSTVGGGYQNTAGGSYNTIGGGKNNTASGNYSIYSTIGGGHYNVSNRLASVVAGGKNNTSSGDYSFVGGGLSNTSSANYSAVVSGRYNEASGSESFVGGGYENFATASYSTISGGHKAKASRYGEHSHAAGSFGTYGDAQHTVLIARKLTTNNTPNQVLFLDNISARLTLPAETTWTFTIKLSAYNDTDNAAAGWIYRGVIRRNNSNSTVLVGSLIEESWKETAMNNASSSVVADDTNEALEIRVTGITGKNIRWVAVIDISQVSYGTP